MPGTKRKGNWTAVGFNTGTYGSPAFAAKLATVRDIDYDGSLTEIDASDADSEKEEILVGIESSPLSFQMAYYKGDTDFDALKAAYKSKSPVAFGVSDGPFDTSGTEVDHGDWIITGFKRNQAYQDLFTVDVVMKPFAGSTNKITTHTVA